MGCGARGEVRRGRDGEGREGRGRQRWVRRTARSAVSEEEGEVGGGSGGGGVRLDREVAAAASRWGRRVRWGKGCDVSYGLCCGGVDGRMDVGW